MYDAEKQNDILVKVTQYFVPSKFLLILPIIMGEDVISMSAINYTVTNYSKDFSSYIMTNGKPLYIHKSYKRKLSIDGKDLFDPFCREVKFPFYYDGENHVVTTTGQLNFYKWSLEIGLLDFIRDNFDDIILHMKRKERKTALAKAVASGNTSSIKSSSYSDSDMTTSEKNRYKNKVLVTETIKTNFKLN